MGRNNSLDLPSFIWLWKIAAWAMGFTLVSYSLLLLSGGKILSSRLNLSRSWGWVKLFHLVTGVTLIFLVLLLLAIGLVGTVGHYGDLGHSSHLWAGLLVVLLVIVSGWSATNIFQGKVWARRLHLFVNALLMIGLIFVSWTGWSVVQKYL